MALDKNIAQALNKQFNNEMQAAHTYLAMGTYFDNNDLPGLANWFRTHGLEEQAHAMRIYDYVYRRDGQIEVDALEKPDIHFQTAEAAILAGYEQEQKVTQQIHELFALAQEAKDYSTQTMLNWFLDEQVEEEDVFRTMLEKVRATENNRWFLMQLDQQLDQPEAVSDTPA